ncbi:MAG: glycosyltransferase family 4 protein [Oscillospiraceae bacterium]|jgi:glycosyltransferase involved in cell wall biosynthesis|nr:glycosyltransferase family 4 protein [Oscillospiraceae bacterium]
MRDNKVCFLTSARRHDDTRIYYREAVTLHKAGYDVVIICPDCQTTDSQGIKFRLADVDRSKHWKKLFLNPFRVLGRAIDENASVYHFHDPELCLTGFFLKLFGKKVVYDVHEDTPRAILAKSWVPAPLRGIISKLFEGFELLLSLTFDGIVASAEVVAKRFPRRKTITVGNFPEVAEFPSVIPDFEKRGHIACMIGTIQEDRGIYDVLDSARYLDYPILLTGEYASEQVQQRVEEESQDLPLRSLGFLERGEVIELLLHSRVGLAPMHQAEHYQMNLPPKIFEYMICEIPVVASDFSYWREILEDSEYGQCGICVDLEDPKSLAKAVTYLMENEDDAIQMGLNGRRAVLERFNWENETQKLLDLYTRLLPLQREEAPQAEASSAPQAL